MVTFVSRHVPDAEGSAAGRQLHAVVTAMREQGADVTTSSWGGREPSALPTWADWRPVPMGARWRVRRDALLHPRSDVARAGIPVQGLMVADDPVSYAAVSTAQQRVATVHYAVALDRRALGRWTPALVQDRRAERRCVADASTVWTFSERVREAVGRGTVVPATIPFPAAPLPLVELPVVGMLADWSWPANAHALRSLLRDWPEVRRQVPGAELVLAGRGELAVAQTDGVRVLGEVPTSADLLGEAAVLAFPCPPTSGPKMKSLDALAYGVPLLTTPAGIEGVEPDAAAVTAEGQEFTDALIRLLKDPQQRAEQASRGLRLVREGNSPEVAARVRLASLNRLVEATGAS